MTPKGQSHEVPVGPRTLMLFFFPSYQLHEEVVLLSHSRIELPRHASLAVTLRFVAAVNQNFFFSPARAAALADCKKGRMGAKPKKKQKTRP